MAGASIPSRDTLAAVSTRAVVDRLLGLSQPDVGKILLTKLVLML